MLKKASSHPPTLARQDAPYRSRRESTGANPGGTLRISMSREQLAGFFSILLTAHPYRSFSQGNPLFE